MSLFRRGDMWWVDVSVPGKERVRRSAGTTDRKQAQEYHDELKMDLWRQVKMGEKPVRYWEEAALQWLKEKSHKLSASDDTRKVAWFDERLRGHKLTQITTDLIRELVENDKADVSPSTRNRYYAVIRSILRAAWKRGWIESSRSFSAIRSRAVLCAG